MKRQLLYIALCAATLTHAGETQKPQAGRFRTFLTYARNISGKALYVPATLTHFIGNKLPNKATLRSAPKATLNSLKRLPRKTITCISALTNALLKTGHYTTVGNAPRVNELCYLQHEGNGQSPRVNGLREAFQAYGNQVRNARTYVTARTSEYVILATALGTGIAYRVFGKDPKIAAIGTGTGTLAGAIAHWFFNRRTHTREITANQKHIIKNVGQQSPSLSAKEINEAYTSACGNHGLVRTTLSQGIFKTQAMCSLKTAALKALTAANTQ